MRKSFIVGCITALILILLLALIFPAVLSVLIIVLPVIALGIYDMHQTEHSLRRNYPVIGRLRNLMEHLRPMVQQYFIESDLDGVPINRVFRSVVYQRAKQEMDTVPYGTKFDVYRVGYEWVAHSLAAKNPADINNDLRIWIGGTDCTQPYHASVFNISAMSFGALSSNAILALNGGAKIGGFYHNTGEGGLSPYHLQHGGDLVWQIGTAYFSCRNAEGGFDEALFAEKAQSSSIKMIEIKLSQGAKPGHGGILPARKNTPEISKIRGVEPYTQINSPATHSTFSNPIELMLFIQKLRRLSNGKPVGFKLCIGQESEFIALCKAMIETGIKPDFITVDGGEGGTGASPVEYTNSIGMPLLDALVVVSDCLTGFDLKKDIKIIATSTVFTGFHIVKRLSLGADLCSSGRGMMLALGCIQSLRCNTDTCPTGVTTQNPALVQALDVNNKRQRVANFQRETVKSVAGIIAAAGLTRLEEVNRSHVFRRVSTTEFKSYQEIYPPLEKGCFLADNIPTRYKNSFATANCPPVFLSDMPDGLTYSIFNIS